MALQPVQLDDLRWSDMVAAVRSRIAAASRGQWTLHSPVDPGITLVELFAWLLEQRLYWLDQTPDSLVLAAMTLLAEKPREAVPAGTVLRIGQPGIVTEGTQFRLAGRGAPLYLTITRTLHAIDVASLSVRKENIDITPDLERGRETEIFERDGAELTVGLTLNAPPIPAGAAGLLFVLDSPDKIEPEWSPDSVDSLPAPADVNWTYSTAPGRSPLPDVEDGTLGFRRSGIVHFSIPPDWVPAASGLYEISAAVASATHSAPPQLSAVEFNCVEAVHRRRVEVAPEAREWLPLPGNTVALPAIDVLPSTVALEIREQANGWQTYRPVNVLSFHGPSDRVLTVDRESGLVRFGDGLTGRLPVLARDGAPNIRGTYEAGAGTRGNVGVGLSWFTESGVPAVNVVAGQGGREPEVIAAARARVSASLHTPERAVTKADYEDLATATPGVAVKRAYAAIGYHPGFPCQKTPGAVTVFIVPEVPRGENAITFIPAPQPDPVALAAVRTHLDAARLIATELYVLGPTYRRVSVELTIFAHAPNSGDLRQKLCRAIRDYLDPLTGGPDAKGWPFGGSIQPSALVRVARTVLNAAAEVESAAVGLNGGSGENCTPVPIGEVELPWLEQLSLRVLPLENDGGGLR